MAEQEAKKDHIKALEEKIAELKKRWPAHSVPPAMLQELDDLEDALNAALQELQEGNSDA